MQMHPGMPSYIHSIMVESIFYIWLDIYTLLLPGPQFLHVCLPHAVEEVAHGPVRVERPDRLLVAASLRDVVEGKRLVSPEFRKLLWLKLRLTFVECAYRPGLRTSEPQMF